MTKLKECTGVLNIAFTKKQYSRTYIESSYARYPLHHSPIMYRHTDVPSMGTLYIQNITGGICAGDRNNIKVKVRDNSAVQITNTSATKLHRMSHCGARDNIEIELYDNAYLEYNPQPLIPFAGSTYSQYVLINLKHTSTLIIKDSIYPGRLAKEERFEYANLSLRTKIICDNKLVCLSAISLSPNAQNLRRKGLFSRYNYICGLYIIAPWCCHKLILDSLKIKTVNTNASMSGVDILPNNIGVYIKIISVSSTGLKSMVDSAYGEIHSTMTKLCGLKAYSI